MRFIEKIFLKYLGLRRIEGTLCFDREVFDLFLSAPYDIAPNFQGSPPSTAKDVRCRDHPRFGRFVYAFAKYYKPHCIVEVGTHLGGTAVGWAKAIVENGRGKLICIDNDSYSEGTYPAIARRNLIETGIADEHLELHNGDSKAIVPHIAEVFRGKVETYLVDGDHTYEGALTDIEKGLPMMRPGGFILVHDVDKNRKMDETSQDHPHPVSEAFFRVIDGSKYEWCILKFIRKHLGVMRVT
ncbi:MAG: class I SAM-dependent methyltransferase [Gemmatimonadota bacterium]|nr:MAG: class I SAM-dependent methyltransferase [Gemmatimonadota bacterium]